MNKSVLVLGAGGHAAVVVEMLRQLDYKIVGLVAHEPPVFQPVFDGIPCFLSDDDVLSFDKSTVLLVNAIGSLPGQNTRFNVYKKFKELGYRFATLVSPNAIVSDYATLSEGVQVMPGAIINANACIGDNSIINSGAIVEHDCVIGHQSHIAPGAVISGGVITGEFVHISTGAKIIQGIHIGEHTVVGAGATVNKHLESNKTLYVAKPFLR
ncbi:acetyltransferase [Marinomonas lutimaris]|uniref:acetyltransferase n=1 Tax=Marinomonas lutimaris TaxID=2846746 RepID=UPI001C6687CF|nr:acetyltransferase [Marinomonas lutimaris]